jgi:hypothetical protein
VSRRRLALLVGGSLLALAVATVLFDGVAAVGSSGWLARPGHDYLLAAAVGAAVVLGGVGVLTAGSLAGFDGATPPQTEEVPAGTPAGAEVDRAIHGDLGPHAHLRGDERVAVRERLRAVAIETLVRVEDCPRREARERVANGEWTDDRVAAAFLAETGPAPLGSRLADAIPGGSRFQRRTDRAVAAVLAHGEGTP